MLLSILSVLLLAASLQAQTPDTSARRRPFWSGHPTPESFAAGVDNRLARARRTRDRLVAATGKRTVGNTLVLYDAIQRDIDGSVNEAHLIAAVHPDSVTRTAAEAAEGRASELSTEISLDRGVYEALEAMDLAGADPATRYYVKRTLLAFRLAGVDKDDATRQRIQALREELVEVGQAFSRNIRDDVRKVEASPADLDGLPADFIASHPAGPDGRVTVTTAYPDALPVFTYARSDDLRKRLRIEFDNRAYPANQAVLEKMIARRDELARLIGYSSWADYITADKMVGSSANASAFIDRIVAASDQAARADYERLLQRKRQDDPEATEVTRWESAYYRELVLRFPARPALLRVRRGEAGRAGRGQPALRSHLPPDARCPGLGPVGRGVGDDGGREAGRAVLSRHASASREVRARRAILNPNGHIGRRPARERTRLQLPRRRGRRSGADDARRGGGALP